MYWSQEDIEDLEIMHANGFRIEKMTRALGRSKHAVRHAIRNLLVRKFASCGTLQQLADELGTSKDVVRNMLAPSKYDLWSRPDSPSEEPVTDADADAAYADDERTSPTASDSGSETDSNTQMAHIPEYSDDDSQNTYVERQRLAELIVERHAFGFAMALFFTVLGIATMIAYTP